MDKNLELIMLPVSAGDATLLLRSDGHNRFAVLIDAGLREDEAVCYLQSQGVFHLDLIILSHPDMDHLGGLLSILNNRRMSVDRIWCFDLGFLREFIMTGRIPHARPTSTFETHYELRLLSTLDVFSRVLEAARGHTQILQVSEGYRLSLGGLLFEVLYPYDAFYDALRNPSALKQLLQGRRLPAEWFDRSEEGRERPHTRPISTAEQHQRLTEMLERSMIPEEELPLLAPGGEGEDQCVEKEDAGSDAMARAEGEKGGIDGDNEDLPWKMVGTLYNNMSIVVRVTPLGGVECPTLLFPGDLTDWTALILRQWRHLKADVLKMPHHGSARVGFDRTIVTDACYTYDEFRYIWHRYWRHLDPFYPVSNRNLDACLHQLSDSSSALNSILQFVNPSRLLVFPYPRHKLPSVQFSGIEPRIRINRMDRRPTTFASPQNEPCPARLSIGLESFDIEDMQI